MLDLLFPRVCLSCQEPLEKKVKIFCSQCREELFLINPKERCPYCFLECHSCREEDTPFAAVASALEYNPVSSKLISKLKYGGAFYLAHGSASLLALQFLNLGWEIPDFIVPIPLSFSRLLTRGYNQSALLAENLSKILDTKMASLLKKIGYTQPQASLNLAQREASFLTFALKKNAPLLEDKVVLLIDDVMTTRKTLTAAANALLEGCPSKIYALTLCRTHLENISMLTEH